MTEKYISEKPKFWEFEILKDLWDFYLSLWIPENQINELINYSLNTDDIELLKNTWDLNRFSSIEKFKNWYEDKDRYLFCLLDKSLNIVWIWWWRPAKSPKVEKIINDEINNFLEKNSESIHTNWIRIYWNFRWKWLTKYLFESEKYYRQIFPNACICVDINKENIPSQKAFEKHWYIYYALWENSKSIKWNQEPRMLYVWLPK